jgi:hypothetical protein
MKVVEVKAEAPVPAAAEPENVKEEPVRVVAPITAPEIGVMLPEPPAVPVKPMPKKAQRALNSVIRTNLAAARPPPIQIQTEVAVPESPQPPPPPSMRSFGYTVPKAAIPSPQIVFGFRK